ncbi:MAG: PilW family protein [Gammaproteobacteria bacterium]
MNDESPEIIARGVERFDVSYGVDTDDDGSVNAYLTAQQWNSLGTTSTLMSLRVAFLVRSINYLREARLGGPTIDFGSGVNKESIAPTPGRLRKAFDYTFVLKNPYTS